MVSNMGHFVPARCCSKGSLYVFKTALVVLWSDQCTGHHSEVNKLSNSSELVQIQSGPAQHDSLLPDNSKADNDSLSSELTRISTTPSLVSNVSSTTSRTSPSEREFGYSLSQSFIPIIFMPWPDSFIDMWEEMLYVFSWSFIITALLLIYQRNQNNGVTLPWQTEESGPIFSHTHVQQQQNSVIFDSIAIPQNPDVTVMEWTLTQLVSSTYESDIFPLPVYSEDFHSTNPSPNVETDSLDHQAQEGDQKISLRPNSPIDKNGDSANNFIPKDDDSLDVYSDPGYFQALEEYETEYNAIPDSFEDIEDSINDALASEPELAARLNSTFQAKWKRENLPVSPGAVSCTNPGESPVQYSGTEPSALTISKEEGTDSQLRGKIQPDKPPNGDEDEDEEQNPPPKKRRNHRDQGDVYRGPKFACHFHKYNPKKYSIRKDPNLTTQEQKRWQICGGQGSKEFRRIM